MLSHIYLHVHPPHPHGPAPAEPPQKHILQHTRVAGFSQKPHKPLHPPHVTSPHHSHTPREEHQGLRQQQLHTDDTHTEPQCRRTHNQTHGANRYRTARKSITHAVCESTRPTAYTHTVIQGYMAAYIHKYITTGLDPSPFLSTPVMQPPPGLACTRHPGVAVVLVTRFLSITLLLLLAKALA